MDRTAAETMAMYEALGQSGPIEPRIGRSLISVVDAVNGQNREYNRWYEDEHMIVSALACPWIFSGRRFVATRAMRDLRVPRDSSVLPGDRGTFLNLYWILDDHYDEFLAWVRSQMENRLYPEGRMPKLRRHVYTNDQAYAGVCYRDAVGPRDIHALAYPYKSVVLQVIDTAKPQDRIAVTGRLLDTELPRLLKNSPFAMCLAFHTIKADKSSSGGDWFDRRITLLWFSDETPTASGLEVHQAAGSALEKDGLGQTQVIAPFVPVLPGTDDHIDQI